MPEARQPCRKVLIVEDDTSIRNLLYTLLAGQGYEAEEAHSSQEALSKIGRECFDAVLLDVRCPYAPPREIIGKIREVRPALIGRILVITAEATDAAGIEMLERHCRIRERDLVWELGNRLRQILHPHPPARAISDGEPSH